jgi:hypothetical protein
VLKFSYCRGGVAHHAGRLITPGATVSISTSAPFLPSTPNHSPDDQLIRPLDISNTSPVQDSDSRDLQPDFPTYFVVRNITRTNSDQCFSLLNKPTDYASKGPSLRPVDNNSDRKS